MEKLLSTLIDRIATGMPELQTVDEDYGQLEAQASENKDMYPLVYPAVLIDAPDTSWSDVSDGAQKGICTINAKLIIDCYDDTHYGSTTTDKISERAVKVKALHELLQNLPIGSDATPLMRTKSRFYTAGGGIKVYEATYTCVVTEVLTVKTTPHKVTKITIATGML